METNLKKTLTLPAVSIFLLLAACHSGAKDSSAMADSANQKEIAVSDSANKAQLRSDDSSAHAKKELLEDASKFLVKSYEYGMFETQLSQLAATNGLDADVKNLAASLFAAHKAINDKISAIAAGANLILPGALNADHQRSLQELGKLTGADFDKKYVNTIIDSHEQSVSLYKDAYKNLTLSDTKTFAGEALPQVEDHLAMAQKVKSRIK